MLPAHMLPSFQSSKQKQQALPVALLFTAIFAMPVVTMAQKETLPPSSSHPVHAIPAELKPALSSITPEKLLHHIKKLASDSLEGRAPGSKGETLTIDYLVAQFKKMGVKPGNPDGAFLQQVLLVGFTTRKASVSFAANHERVALNYPDDFVACSPRGKNSMSILDAEVVFAGYGIIAPEYGWDDYKNVDVKGEVVVVLDTELVRQQINDSTKIDSSFFKGASLTYYAFRSYKYDLAARKGAVAVLIMHNPKTSYSPYKVFQNNFLLEQMELKTAANNLSSLAAQGFLSQSGFQHLCDAANVHGDTLQRMTRSKDFSPVALPVKASIEVESKLREITSHNVVAKVEGSDKHLRNEYVIYTAHWDHLGMDTTLKGDQIFTGAGDNASGAASLLEIAAGFARLKIKQSALFFLLSLPPRRRDC